MTHYTSAVSGDDCSWPAADAAERPDWSRSARLQTERKRDLEVFRGPASGSRTAARSKATPPQPFVQQASGHWRTWSCSLPGTTAPEATTSSVRSKTQTRSATPAHCAPRLAPRRPQTPKTPRQTKTLRHVRCRTDRMPCPWLQTSAWQCRAGQRPKPTRLTIAKHEKDPLDTG